MAAPIVTTALDKSTPYTPGAPIVTTALDKSTPYTPGAPIVLSWTVVDADNSSETVRLTGVDGQGNEWTAELQVPRQDTFAMTEVKWVRTGVALAIDNSGRKATGVVPAA